MAKKGLRRDPLEGIPYGVNALIRNEGSSVEPIPLREIDLDDELLRTRPAKDLSLLQESISLQGQLSPVVLRNNEATGGWQIVSGFRRIEAIKGLGQSIVQARLYDAMDDVQALRLAILENFFSGDLSGEDLDAYAAHLGEKGMLSAPASEVIDWAREKVARVAKVSQGSGLSEEGGDAISFTHLEGDPNLPLPGQIRLTFTHLSEAAQGLERIFLNWSDVTASDRRVLAAECKYIHDIYPFLTR